MAITIDLAPEEEAQLRHKAAREGQQTEAVARAVIVRALAWDAQDRAEAIEGIQQGLVAFEQGHCRRFSEFEAEQRLKYNLPNDT
jgi:hypothetical protein